MENQATHKPEGMYTLITVIAVAAFVTINQNTGGLQDGKTFTAAQMATGFNILLLLSTVAAYLVVYYFSKKKHD